MTFLHVTVLPFRTRPPTAAKRGSTAPERSITELSIFYIILLKLRYEKRQGPCPILLPHQGDPALHNIHDDRNIAQLFCPVMVYHKQSGGKCQSLCRGLPKLYRDHKKILRRSGFFAGRRIFSPFRPLSARRPSGSRPVRCCHPLHRWNHRLPPSGNTHRCRWHR